MSLKGKTSLNRSIERMEILYENIYNLLIAFQQASSSNNNSEIFVELKNDDGSIKRIQVNSFQELKQEITRLENNFAALTNKNNVSYILNGDGTISQYTKTTFMNAQYIDLDDITVDTNCVVDTNTVISDLLYPLVKVPLKIDSSFVQSTIVCKSYKITDGFELIPDNVSYVELKNLIENGTVVSDMEIERILNPTKEQVKYFGKFNIETIENTSDSELFNVTLDNVYYTGLNVNGNSIQLQVNDVLVTKTGASKWLIEDISVFNRLVKLRRIAGTENLSVGIEKLLFNQAIDTESYIVGIPVKPSENLIVFISTESGSAISYPSNGLKLSSENYNVIYNNVTYSIDEFYSNYVTNLSDYLMSIIENNTIPYSLGIKPRTPELLASNFQVLQINKHITNSKSIQDINSLNVQKQGIMNDIETKESLIKEIKFNIRSNYYTTDAELRQKQNEISSIQDEIDTLNANLLSITRRIDLDSTQSNLKESKAKYKIVGFWSIQNDLYSNTTGLQKIIKYDVQYRYLNRNSENIENPVLKMIDDGNEISVAFSAWNTLETPTLNKVKNIDGSYSWEEQSMQDVDDININQCMISISENESVEIRVRAVTEAGYPISPMKSDWSNIIRINFPDDLIQNNVNNIIEQNQTDLYKSEFLNLLKTYGITEHVNTQIVETDRLFVHEAKQITSGLFTSEMKNIPLDEAIKSFKTRLESLEASLTIRPISISIIDFEGTEYNIENNQTLTLFGGKLSSEIDISNTDNYGKIMKKRCYVKIKNPNNTPIDIKSLQPIGIGQLDSIYLDVPIQKNSITTSFEQEEGQIIYFRNVDLSLSNNFPLYQRYNQETPTDQSSIDNTHSNRDNIKYLLNNSIESGYVTSSQKDVLAILINTPADLQTISFLQNVEKHVSITKSDKQVRITSGQYPFNQIGFSENDIWLVGEKTLGAYFYPVFGNIDRYKVRGNNSTSTFVLSGNQEILLPLEFEYRMIDALGRTISDNGTGEVVVQKTLGVSLNVSNQPFTFDITAFVKL